MRRRALAVAALALCAVPALATGSDSKRAAAAPGALAVDAALDRCGVLQAQVVCKLDVSYGTLPNATSYTANVTRADGSVADYGDVGAGSSSLWVPYAGPGVYSVEVSAYGTPLPGGPLRLLDADRGGMTGGTGARGRGAGTRTIPFDVDDDGSTKQLGDKLGAGAPGAGGEQGGEPPAPGCSDESDEGPEEQPAEQPPVEEPPVDEPPVDAPPVEEVAPPAASDGSAAPPLELAPGLLDAAGQPVAEPPLEDPELPDSIDCPGD